MLRPFAFLVVAGPMTEHRLHVYQGARSPAKIKPRLCVILGSGARLRLCRRRELDVLRIAPKRCIDAARRPAPRVLARNRLRV